MKAGLTPRSGFGALLAALLLFGCESPDDAVTEVAPLTGVITGTVLDGNGTPIPGVTVRYTGATSTAKAEVSALTNASGQFELRGVIVTSVSSVGVNDANGPITLVVEGPIEGTRYMGATVQVSPTAQSATSVGGDTVFIDDFNVDTGPIRLPALDTTVRGTLRDAATGAPRAGVPVTLDFLGVEFDQDGTTGVASTYDSGANLVATSGADGVFEFAEVYADVCLRLDVAGSDVTSVTGSAPPCGVTVVGNPDPNALYFSTVQDGGTVQLANVYVNAFDDGDTIAPTVAAVAGVVDPSVAPALLESSVTGVAPGELVVTFSEPMQAIVEAADVEVRVGTEPDQYLAQTTAVILSDNTDLGIELAVAVPPSQPVTLRLLREALRDLAGNGVALSGSLAYDAFGGTSSQFLELALTSAVVADEVRPVATGVEGVAEASAHPGALDAAVDGTGEAPLVIAFSEPLRDSVELGEVEVRVGAEQTPAVIRSVTLLGGNRLEVVLDDALPSDSEVTVLIPRSELDDLAGNAITLNDALGYDDFSGASNEFFTLLLVSAPAATQP